MSLYLDANVLVAIFTDDAFSSRAEAYLGSNPDLMIVSDFAALELSAVVARRIRTRTMAAGEAQVALAVFDGWAARKTQRVEIHPGDVTAADTFLRGHALPLRAPDAIHLAIARRSDAVLVSFDVQMDAAARVLGIPVAPA